MVQEADIAVRGGDAHCYYRLPDGTVELASANPNERLKFMDMGYTPLLQYGTFIWGPHLVDRPYDVLLQRGGAKELSAEQVLSFGWSHSPPKIVSCGIAPTRGVHRHTAGCFRQMKAKEFEQVKPGGSPSNCRWCNRSGIPTEAARDQHESVMHSDRLGPTEMGKAITEGLAKVLGPQIKE